MELSVIGRQKLISPMLSWSAPIIIGRCLAFPSAYKYCTVLRFALRVLFHAGVLHSQGAHSFFESLLLFLKQPIRVRNIHQPTPFLSVAPESPYSVLGSYIKRGQRMLNRRF